jgi:hypothetical protein
MPHRTHPAATAFVATVLAASIVAAPQIAAAQSSTATYEVTFDATWSAATHPTDFPSNAHFSPLVGGTHNGDVVFWTEGELATLGIQRMAEWGATQYLEDEVTAAMTAGDAGETIVGGLIAVSPGSATATFTVTTEFPRVTLTSMIAPSPDWFVGVTGLELYQSGAWVEELVVTLWPYDAGTDSGVSYGSPDLPSDPHVPIAQITGAPFEPGVPIGTFTFALQATTDVPSAGQSLSVDAYPNPFNPRTTIAYELPVAGRLQMAVYDLRGRLVHMLLDRESAAGTGSVDWDGRDRAGRALAGGTYLLRTTVAGHEAVRKLTLTK